MFRTYVAIIRIDFNWNLFERFGHNWKLNKAAPFCLPKTELTNNDDTDDEGKNQDRNVFWGCSISYNIRY